MGIFSGAAAALGGALRRGAAAIEAAASPYPYGQPPRVDPYLAGVDITREKALGLSGDAFGVPYYQNKVLEIDALAYHLIARCDATAGPLRKRAEEVAARGLRVQCPQSKDLEALIQSRIIDRIAGLGPALHWLSYADVEGWRVVRINYRQDIKDDFVPSFVAAGRKKASAGGNLRWDGFNLFKVREYVGLMQDPANMQEAMLDRSIYILHLPHATSSPEGDTEFAERLLAHAHDYNTACKSLLTYLSRANPFYFAQVNAKHVSPTVLAARKQAVADAVVDAQRAGVLVDSDFISAVQAVNIEGTALAGLLDAVQVKRDQAHQAILHQSLTTSTADTGPTGSSAVAERTEDRAIDTVCTLLAETLNRDLVSWIQRYNPWTAVAPWKLVIDAQPVVEMAKPEQFIAGMSAGLSFRSADVYAAFGAQPPADVPTTLTVEAPAPQPAQQELP